MPSRGTSKMVKIDASEAVENPCVCGHARVMHYGTATDSPAGCSLCNCNGWMVSKSEHAPQPSLSWLPESLGTMVAESKRHHRSDGNPAMYWMIFCGGAWEAKDKNGLLHRGHLDDAIAACERKERE